MTFWRCSFLVTFVLYNTTTSKAEVQRLDQLQHQQPQNQVLTRSQWWSRFEDATRCVLGNWTALHMACANNWGDGDRYFMCTGVQMYASTRGAVQCTILIFGRIMPNSLLPMIVFVHQHAEKRAIFARTFDPYSKAQGAPVPGRTGALP